jgi:hypothetical protein
LTTAMPRCRPFKLIDAMIPTAAAVVCMARMCTLWNELRVVGMAGRMGIPGRLRAGTVPTGLNLALLVLVVAYLVIRLIPPRPPGSDLIRQPGMLLFGLLIRLSTLSMALSAFVPRVAWTKSSPRFSGRPGVPRAAVIDHVPGRDGSKVQADPLESAWSFPPRRATPWLSRRPDRKVACASGSGGGRGKAARFRPR